MKALLLMLLAAVSLMGCERVENGGFVTDKQAYKRDFLDCVAALPTGSDAGAVEVCNDTAYRMNTNFVRAK